MGSPPKSLQPLQNHSPPSESGACPRMNTALKQPLWFEWHIHINLGVKSIFIYYCDTLAYILDISGHEVKMKSLENSFNLNIFHLI